MDNLIMVLENFVQLLDGTNIIPETDEDSNIELTVSGLDYKSNSLIISELVQDAYEPDDEAVEFIISLSANFHILFEWDDYSEASHDNEDDQWFGVTSASEEHLYNTSFEIRVELDLTTGNFTVLTPQNDIQPVVNIHNFIE